jgi:hypothetical protein
MGDTRARLVFMVVVDVDVEDLVTGDAAGRTAAELQILADGEILLCRQCANEHQARTQARRWPSAIYLRQSCVAIEKGTA